jgi:hypothetical protein
MKKAIPMAALAIICLTDDAVAKKCTEHFKICVATRTVMDTGKGTCEKRLENARQFKLWLNKKGETIPCEP